ncbi:transporter [Mobilitalea sibirica]|uniref:Transporter n=1 Tax=Mobilitalea sibirica TaxID=1462919 RepID=A0A8J7GX91_9FIRM|nr:transporter [Mobilitalea sibirica]MBH1939714.1 transporter [Mobilitalea sibirica]
MKKILSNPKNKLIKGAVLLFFIIMFLYPYASYEGASTGLLLWFINVLPTLLPFIIISNLMIRLNISKQISRILYPVIGKLFRVSSEGCYPILIGFLSGIPMGAKTTADLVSEEKINEDEGNFLLTMCNNYSPVFIMSYIVINQLKLPRIRYSLFVILYLSSIISAVIYRFYINRRRFNITTKGPIPPSKTKPIQATSKSARFSFQILDSSIMNGFEVITKIGGYIILFSILAQIINQIGPGNGLLKASFMGILEITTGINQICKADINIHMKIVLAAVLTSFGGLSGMAQTKSVLGDTRLSMKSYFIVKLINTVITFVLALLYVALFRIV